MRGRLIKWQMDEISIILSASKSRPRCERILHNMPLNNLEQTISVESIVHDTSLWNFLRSYENTGYISFSVGELPLRFLYHNDQLPWNQDMLEARGFVLMY